MGWGLVPVLKSNFIDLVPLTRNIIEHDFWCSARHKVAADAKKYLDLYDVWGTIQNMLHAILKQRPEVRPAQENRERAFKYTLHLASKKYFGPARFSIVSHIGGWGMSPAGESFPFVRACGRALWLPSGIGSQK